MPVEIRELVIRATIEPGDKKPQPAADQGKGKVDEVMIAECVEQVLEILRKERER